MSPQVESAVKFDPWVEFCKVSVITETACLPLQDAEGECVDMQNLCKSMCGCIYIYIYMRVYIYMCVYLNLKERTNWRGRQLRYNVLASRHVR